MLLRPATRKIVAGIVVALGAISFAPLYAVWPMPQYNSYPNCSGTSPSENCSQQSGDPNLHWQIKLSDRSVQYPTTYSCTPVSGQFGGFCDGPGCISEAGFCRQPAILGTPSYDIVTRADGAYVRFHLEYDFAGNYCQLSPDGNVAEWPIVFNNYHLDRLQVLDSDSGNIIAESMAVFEHGQWNPLVRFCGKGNFLLRVLNKCAGQSQTYPVSIDASNIPSVSLTPCAGDRNCFFCWLSNGGPSIPGGVGKPINVGSGDVGLQVPLFTIGQPPLSLSMTLTYHSQIAGNPRRINEPMGKGWTHTFNESLRAIDPFTNELYRLRADGSEAWYRPVGNGMWVSQTPGELRETVTLAGSQLQVKDLNGTVIAFDAASGNWLSTTDRWGSHLFGTSANNLLTAITDAEGRQIQLGYTNNQLTQIMLPDGTAWRFAYGGGELTQLFDPNHAGATPWRLFEYQPDTRGTLRLLTAMKDEVGALIEGHAYDAFERGISSYAGASRELVNVQYNGTNPTQALVTSSIDETTTQTVTFTLMYQRGRFLPVEIEGNCSSCGGGDDDEKFSFDGSNFPVSKTDGDGHVTTYAYDANGNMTTRVDAVSTPDQRTTTFTYGYASWPSFMTRMTEMSAARPGLLKTTTHAWNGSGTPETTLTTAQTGWLRGSGAASTTYTTVETFDARHRSLALDGPRTDVADVTTRTYFGDADANANRRGRLQSTTDAAGLTTSFDDYNVFGTSRTITDSNDVQTAVQTDARGRVVSTTNKTVSGDSRESTDYTSTMTYDGRDRLIRQTMPRANAVRFAYEDGTNWLTDTVRLDGSGNEVERRHVTLNIIDDKLREEDQQCASPSASCTSWVTKRQDDFVYDQHNRLAQIVHPTPPGSSVTYRYDGAGLLQSVQDENHAAPNAFYGYDPLNRLTSVRQTLNGSAITTTYGYDVQDNLVAVTDPNGNTTTYAYDDFRRMQTQTSPVTGTTVYNYDPAGNLTSSTDANGATTTRTYDALNRIISATSTSGASSEAVTYTYDSATAGNYGKGRLASVSDPTGSMTYSYERRGLLRVEGHTIEGNAYSMAYGYDANGNRASMTYPSGRVVQYAFDFADRAQSATSAGTTLVGSASYLPFGPETQLTFGNATVKTSSFDLRYRPAENRLTGALGVIADYGYSEDAVGNITAIRDLTDARYDRTFGYDDLNRLTSAGGGGALWGSGFYRYDAMGNMTSLGLGSARQSSFAYDGTSPKLTAVTENGVARGVAYDAAGNEQTVGAETFAYSPRNFLSSADGLTCSYDARGVRTITTVTNALGSFSGNVVTAAGGAPVSNAVVTIDGTLNSTITDGNGNFSLNQLAGNYTLTVVKLGYLPETTTAFTLLAGANVGVGLVKLSVAPSTISGTVVSSLGGNVAGATVALFGTAATASTDASGHFSIKQPAATFTATITAGGYTTQTTLSFTTEPGQTYSLGTITLAAIPATITGTITSSTGGAVAGATVTASGGANGASHGGRVVALANGAWTTTDGSGNFTLSLAAGTYTLTISRDGFGTLSTSQFIVGPGSTFSFGTLLIDPLGTISGTVVSQASGSPLANATVSVSGSINVVSTDATGRFSIQQPPGFYSAHVSATGFADVNTPFFTLAPGATYDTGAIQLSAVALAVYVGYADDLRASANFPVPWVGAANVIYIGSNSPFDAGAIRLDNNTDVPMPIEGVTVDLGRPGPTFNLWGTFTVPSHGSVILTQTTQFNFDTSDCPIAQCGQPLVAGDPRVSRVIVRTNGATTTYFDTGHVLDTGGYDLACHGNESLQWRLIGTTGINANGDFLLGPPTGTSPLGQPYTVTASVTDGTGQPISGAVVTFKIVQGPNRGTTGSATTDSSGKASFTYTSHTAGTDTIQATITNASGGTPTSNPVTVTWPAFSNIAVFVGYADDLRPAPAFPNPWRGSPGVLYIGSNSPIDAGAVRIDNLSDQPVTVSNVTVDLQHPGPAFSLWGSFTISAHGTAILTQTTQYNFDTSDFSYQPCFVPAPPTDPRIPKITINVGGQAASYLDTGHILDTFGYDFGLNCASENESLQWRAVGSSSTASAGNLALRPLSSVNAVGAICTATAIATDAGNEPVANLAVDFRIVTGPNAGKTGRMTTNSSGIATFSYSSIAAGTDTVRASITNSTGGVVTSNDVTASWISTVALQLSPGSATTTINTPYNATVLVTDGSGTALPNVLVTFRVTGGPNAGKSASGMTDTTGHALFSYFSAVVGTDTLAASVVGPNGGSILSNVVSAIWVAPVAITLAPSSATTPLGTNYTATAFVSSGGAPAAGALVDFSVLAGPNTGRTYSATTDGTGHAAFTFTSAAVGIDVVHAATGSVTSNQVVAKWVSIPTLLAYTGALAGEYGDPLTLSARLTEAASGNPVPGQTIEFNLGGQTLNATTDANGTASLSLTASMTPGAVPLSVSFAAASAHSSTSASLYINVVRDESAIRYTGKTVVAGGMAQTVTAVLRDPDGGQPLAGRTVSFIIGSMVATTTTDANGIASAEVTLPLTLGTGPIRLEVSFAGDATNVAASTSVSVILYQPESFVIWGGNAMVPRVGDRVNFWGSQWAAQVTGGDYDHTADFKGWGVPAGSPLEPCGGQCWSSKPGESFPPGSIERHISVIVSTAIGQMNGAVVGNIASTVVVRVDPVPVYANVPGKPGYGVIVGVIEDPAHLFGAATMTAMLHSAPTSVAAGTRRYSFYTREMNLMAETALTTGNKPPIAYEYVWFNGHPVAQFDAATSTPHWTFTDHLGTPIVLTNSDASTYWRAEYEPYGSVYALRSPDVHQPLRLPGQEAEQLDTGANGVAEREYNIFRWYRSSWGRYAQADPIGVDGGMNLYAYSLEEPIRFTDRLGLDTVGCDSYMGRSETLCELRCCAKHDECYDRNHCTSGSWKHPKCGCDETAGCKKCNSDVEKCMSNCNFGLGDFMHRGDPQFYCAKQHRYVRIPGDFPDRKTAEPLCEEDHENDCRTPLTPKKPKKPWYKRVL